MTKLQFRKRLGRIEELANLSVISAITPPVLGRAITSRGKRLLRTQFFLVAAFPKSGSTLLTQTLARLPSFALAQAVPGFDRREQELEESKLWSTLAIRKNTVFQHHVRHSVHTETLINRYPFHLIVLVRNLYDVCASMYDHLFNESPIIPFAFCNSSILKDLDSRELRFNFVVDLIVPWYINFFVGWHYYDKQSDAVIQWISYEDLVADQHHTIKSILDKAGTSLDDTMIRSAISADTYSRFNRGIIGRGKEFLDCHPSTRETIHKYCAYYPSVDFSRICPDL